MNVTGLSQHCFKVETLAARSAQRFWAMLGLLALILGVVIVLCLLVTRQMSDVIKP